MSEASSHEGGLLAVLPRLWRTVRLLATSRVELFLLELQEERLRLFDALLLAAATAVCGAFALGLLTLTLVVAFWEQCRVLVLALLTLAFAGGAGGGFWILRRRLLRWQAFAATREQLKKDCACFATDN